MRPCQRIVALSAIQKGVKSYHQNGHAYPQNGQAYQQNGYAYQQNGHSYQQNGQAYQQNGHANQQNGQVYQQNGHANQQNGQAYQQNGHANQQNGQVYQQNGHAYPQKVKAKAVYKVNHLNYANLKKNPPSFSQVNQRAPAPTDVASGTPKRAIIQDPTSELLRCLGEFLCRRCPRVKLSPTDPELWLRTVDRALLVLGYQAQNFFTTPASVVFVYMMCRDVVSSEVTTQHELQAVLLTCLYLSYAYVGNEISYPVKPFLVESSRETFWARCLSIIDRMSAKMLQINLDPDFYTEVLDELKNKRQEEKTVSQVKASPNGLGNLNGSGERKGVAAGSGPPARHVVVRFEEVGGVQMVKSLRLRLSLDRELGAVEFTKVLADGDLLIACVNEIQVRLALGLSIVGGLQVREVVRESKGGGFQERNFYN